MHELSVNISWDSKEILNKTREETRLDIVNSSHSRKYMIKGTAGLDIYPRKNNYFLNTCCISHGEENSIEEWGEHDNMHGLMIFSSKKV